MHPGGRGNPALQDRNLTIWDILPKAQAPDGRFRARLATLIAGPGYGKTTLMHFLTLNFANGGYGEKGAKELIPVLLKFRDFHGKIQGQNDPSLPQLIVETVQQLPRCDSLRASEPWFRDRLQQGKCLVMLDGLDEVPDDQPAGAPYNQRELASQWANWQMENYPSQFILTSRPHGYNSSFFPGADRIDVLDFNDDQKRTFIEKWYRFIAWETKWRWHYIESQRQPNSARHLSEAQVKAQSQQEADDAAADLRRQLFADRSLIDLAKNPLLLTIIAVAHKYKERLPQRRLDVYREILKLLLEDRPYQRQTRLTIANAADNQFISLRVVRQQIPDRYRELVNYLASGSWREADQETYEVMKNLAGGRLSVEAIQKFPCDDLRIIDQLWVKFSGGQFGFSVQKQIYVETGNPLDGKYHEETWEKFCDRVGWRTGNEYVNYSDLKTNPSLSPTGEFPFRFCATVTVVMATHSRSFLGASLLSHRNL
jgi:hypothetical protein